MKLFLVYASADTKKLSSLIQLLKIKGHEVFDPHSDVPPGEIVMDVLRAEISYSCAVAIVTAHYFCLSDSTNLTDTRLAELTKHQRIPAYVISPCLYEYAQGVVVRGAGIVNNQFILSDIELIENKWRINGLF